MKKWYYIKRPDESMMIQAGFRALINTPFIFDSDWCYQEIPSKYLRHRTLGRTPVSLRSSSTKLPTKTSIKNFSDWLINFLSWLVWKKKDWESLNYTDDILFGYQQDMQSGEWSEKGDRLAARTINCRVGIACDFLEWSAQQGYRPSLSVPYKTKKMRLSSASSTTRRNEIEIHRRLGAPRPNPLHLTLPSKPEVEAWLKDTEIASGKVHALMCKLIAETGIRREECALWGIDTLPLNRNLWIQNSTHVMVKIRDGTKGSKQSPSSTEGPERSISIPIELALELQDYRENIRYKLQAKYVNGGKNGSEKLRRKRIADGRFFLSEHSGVPVSAQMLYRAWKKIPIKGWHPHQGRHYWACMKILELCPITEFSDLSKKGLEAKDNIAYKASVMDVIELVVKPQLGHLSEDTSKTYCEFALRLYLFPEIADAYERNLEKN